MQRKFDANFACSDREPRIQIHEVLYVAIVRG